MDAITIKDNEFIRAVKVIAAGKRVVTNENNDFFGKLTVCFQKGQITHF